MLDKQENQIHIENDWLLIIEQIERDCKVLVLVWKYYTCRVEISNKLSTFANSIALIRIRMRRTNLLKHLSLQECYSYVLDIVFDMRKSLVMGNVIM